MTKKMHRQIHIIQQFVDFKRYRQWSRHFSSVSFRSDLWWWYWVRFVWPFFVLVWICGFMYI